MDRLTTAAECEKCGRLFLQYMDVLSHLLNVWRTLELRRYTLYDYREAEATDYRCPTRGEYSV